MAVLKYKDPGSGQWLPVSTGTIAAGGDARVSVSLRAAQTIPYNAGTKFAWDTVDLAAAGGISYDAANQNFTITVAGLYLINAHILWAPDTATYYRHVRLYKNNALIDYTQQIADVTTNTTQELVRQLYLQVGDVIDIRGFTNDTGGTATAAQAGFPTSGLEISRVDIVGPPGPTGPSGSWAATELDGTADLNNVTTPGLYTQSSNSEAASGGNYPVAQAGLLEVFGNGVGVGNVSSEAWQRYTVYSGSTSVPGFKYERGYYQNAPGGTPGWSAWRMTFGDTGWIDGGAGSSIIAADPTNFTLTGSWVRVTNNQVWVYIVGTSKITINAGSTTGDVSNVAMGTMAAPYRPPAAGPNQSIPQGYIGRLTAWTVSAGSGAVSFTATTPNTNVNIGDPISLSGSYLI